MKNFGEKNSLRPKKLLDAAAVSDFDEFRAKNAYPTVESLKGKNHFPAARKGQPGNVHAARSRYAKKAR
ncbi:MAG: hypothetical protein L6V85_00325 [Clostridiales bacterium]|nr:MAG: hypothetical protein L6V85_00325 [Clostridiales bacterium]